jgi:hypothetical protein
MARDSECTSDKVEMESSDDSLALFGKKFPSTPSCALSQIEPNSISNTKFKKACITKRVSLHSIIEDV